LGIEFSLKTNIYTLDKTINYRNSQEYTMSTVAPLSPAIPALDRDASIPFSARTAPQKISDNIPLTLSQVVWKIVGILAKIVIGGGMGAIIVPIISFGAIPAAIGAGIGAGIVFGLTRNRGKSAMEVPNIAPARRAPVTVTTTIQWDIPEYLLDQITRGLLASESSNRLDNVKQMKIFLNLTVKGETIQQDIFFNIEDEQTLDRALLESELKSRLQELPPEFVVSGDFSFKWCALIIDQNEQLHSASGEQKDPNSPEYFGSESPGSGYGVFVRHFGLRFKEIERSPKEHCIWNKRANTIKFK
jgi:hypothetical protein